MIKITLALFLFTRLLFADAIVPIPLSVEYDKAKAALGKKLFFDPGLSKDGSISCASCHQLPGSGADVNPYSFGVNGSEGAIHSPTVLNSGFNFVQFWDGRAKDLKAQAKQPIENPVEMANTLSAAVKYVKSNPSYVSGFNKSYKEGLNEDTMVDAIAEFEKALFTPNSKFDQYLRGNEKALSKQEKAGYTLFKDYGCISCHNGVNMGGNMFQRFGALSIYKSEKNQLGRYDVTQRQMDKYFFKVPTLRNIALTSPYLHDGSVTTLKGAIFSMMKHQVGIAPHEDDIEKIESFLKTLTGESPSILREKD